MFFILLLISCCAPVANRIAGLAFLQPQGESRLYAVNRRILKERVHKACIEFGQTIKSIRT